MPLEEKDRWHRTPLHWAALNGHASVVAVLVELGASPNPPTVKLGYHVKSTSLLMETPVHIALRLCVAGACVGVVADGDACGGAGGPGGAVGTEGPQAAAQASALLVLRLLLEAGADIDAMDQAGVTPRMYAQNMGREDLLLGYAIDGKLTKRAC